MALAREVRTTAAMFWRLALVLLLAGYASGQRGPELESLTTMGPPAGGMARIVVMRPEYGFFSLGDGGDHSGDRSFGIKLDDQPMGDLMTGTFVWGDRPAGRHQIAADLWDIPGVTRYDLNTAPGRTYYVVAKLNESVNRVYGAQILGGLAGKFIVAGASGLGGDVRTDEAVRARARPAGADQLIRCLILPFHLTICCGRNRSLWIINNDRFHG